MSSKLTSRVALTSHATVLSFKPFFFSNKIKTHPRIYCKHCVHIGSSSAKFSLTSPPLALIFHTAYFSLSFSPSHSFVHLDTLYGDMRIEGPVMASFEFAYFRERIRVYFNFWLKQKAKPSETETRVQIISFHTSFCYIQFVIYDFRSIWVENNNYETSYTYIIQCIIYTYTK